MVIDFRDRGRIESLSTVAEAARGSRNVDVLLTAEQQADVYRLLQGQQARGQVPAGGAAVEWSAMTFRVVA